MAFDDCGIGGWGGIPMTNYTVSNNHVYDIGGGSCVTYPGQPAEDPTMHYPPMGNGISINGQKNVIVTGNNVHDTGGCMWNQGAGPVGITTNGADTVHIFKNTVANIRPVNPTVIPMDMDGIDIDTDSVNVLVEDNDVTGSYGAGLTMFSTGGVWNNNTIRGNRTNNNGTAGRLGFGEIAVIIQSGSPTFSVTDNTTVNNLTFSGPLYQNLNQGVPGISITGAQTATGDIARNYLSVNSANDGHANLILARFYDGSPPGPNVKFHDNTYNVLSGVPLVVWGANPYPAGWAWTMDGLAQWQAATGNGVNDRIAP